MKLPPMERVMADVTVLFLLALALFVVADFVAMDRLLSRMVPGASCALSAEWTQTWRERAAAQALAARMAKAEEAKREAPPAPAPKSPEAPK